MRRIIVDTLGGLYDFLKLLHARIVPGGSVITTDPLNTCASIRLARRLYRPFQSDVAWEWPFTQQILAEIERYFQIEAVQGVMGQTSSLLT